MLEKIGLPSKPSMRQNNWVVDASHCQGCGSQFTIINRKHHCRRCGGLFCGRCTSQRMVLRGQGDSAVRICDACKKLEDAARFELRHGQRTRPARGATKLECKNEVDGDLKKILGATKLESRSEVDEVLDEILGSQMKDLPSSLPSLVSFSASSSSSLGFSASSDPGLLDDGGKVSDDTESVGSERLSIQAQEEKQKYKLLKKEGKDEEALKAFKRAKELERQAQALKLLERKNQKKLVTAVTINDTPKVLEKRKKGVVVEKNDDLMAELGKLGWSESDSEDVSKERKGASEEEELAFLIKEASQGAKIDKSEVLVHKRKALALKREGKLTEAKEELKKAKLLERKLEEQELFGGAEESDDELSALIRSMDDNEVDLKEYEPDRGFDLNQFSINVGNIGSEVTVEVTEEDMLDPEMTAILASLGWNDEIHISPENGNLSRMKVKEEISNEVFSLKQEALIQKRAGNSAEALALLKKAKLLEKDLGSSNGDSKTSSNVKEKLSFEASAIQDSTNTTPNYSKLDESPLASSSEQKSVGVAFTLPLGKSRRSKAEIQKELLVLKRKSLALRRQGKMNEAEEVLREAKVLETEIAQLDAPKTEMQPDFTKLMADRSTTVNAGDAVFATDKDLSDSTHLSMLEIRSPYKISAPRLRSKTEIQRDLLGLKRTALTHRRNGETEEADKLLKKAQLLEAELEESDCEVAKSNILNEKQSYYGNSVNSTVDPTKAFTDVNVDDLMEYKLDHNFDSNNLESIGGSIGSESDVEVTVEDMLDPEMAAALASLGWNDGIHIPQDRHNLSSLEGFSNEACSVKQAINQKRSGNAAVVIKATPNYPKHDDSPPLSRTKQTSRRSKAEIQKELLSLKRKSLAMRRQGKMEEAEEVLQEAKVLESEIAQFDAPKAEVQPSFSNLMVDINNAADAGDAVVGADKVVSDPTKLSFGSDSDVGVTVEDMIDPEIAAALKSFGWTNDFSEENQTAEAQVSNKTVANSRLGIRRRLDALKKKAAPLKGRSNNTVEEFKRYSTQADRLEAADNFSLMNAASEPSIDDVTDQDLFDPSYLSILKSMGCEDENADRSSVALTPSKQNENASVRTVEGLTSDLHKTISSKKTPRNIQQKILGLKRKAQAHRREGKVEEAEKLLQNAQLLEDELQEIDSRDGNASNLVDFLEVPELLIDQNGESLPSTSVSRNNFGDGNAQLIADGGSSLKKKTTPLQKEGSDPTKADSNMTDFLTGDYWERFNNSSAKVKTGMIKVVEEPYVVDDILATSRMNISGNVNSQFAESGEKLMESSYLQIHQESSFESRSVVDTNSVWQEVSARKKKAVALKRQGRLTEAKEELRQAKLLEKSAAESDASNVSSSVPAAPVIQQEKLTSFKQRAKPLSGRDRFKLQQECLTHKRQAMKLRQQGRVEEADSELQLAKDLEAQLEEASENQTNSSGPSMDADAQVEDFLDPQLLSALKAIGIDHTSPPSKEQKKPQVSEPAKPSKEKPLKIDQTSPERKQLEERIKAEKVKAVNLKRSGQQAEALDAFRRAKLLEKKLDTLASG